MPPDPLTKTGTESGPPLGPFCRFWWRAPQREQKRLYDINKKKILGFAQNDMGCGTRYTTGCFSDRT
jgi:hypothetical protein